MRLIERPSSMPELGRCYYLVAQDPRAGIAAAIKYYDTARENRAAIWFNRDADSLAVHREGKAA